MTTVETKPATDLFDGIDGIVAAKHKQVVADLKKRLAKKSEQIAGLKNLNRSYLDELKEVREERDHYQRLVEADLSPQPIRGDDYGDYDQDKDNDRIFFASDEGQALLEIFSKEFPTRTAPAPFLAPQATESDWDNTLPF